MAISGRRSRVMATPCIRWLVTIVSVLTADVAFPASIEQVDARQLTVVTDAAYPEGPLWLSGRLYFVEYAAGDVKSWDGSEVRQVWEDHRCGPSGLIRFGDDDLLVACYDANSLVELDHAGRVVRTFTRDSAGDPLNGPNDFAPDGHGGVYISASGVYDTAAPITGSLLHLSADGKSLTKLAGTIHYPNGLTLDGSGQHLLVAEMLADRILSFAVNPDGSLGERRVWARMQDLVPPVPGQDAYTGPDGFKRGADGNFYIADNGTGRVVVVDDQRALVRVIRVPTPFVTNVAFGADGAATVFVTGAFDQWKSPFAGAVYYWRP